ncbi:MAG: LPS assembly lipoprotein LptE [Mariprofundaceae bacterium]|nr:LPS assembly lipoprotein LptE [Mariprofundaceae bacterium]
MLLLTACGYHLVGQGEGAGLIQKNEVIYAQADSAVAQTLRDDLVKELERRGYSISDDSAITAVSLHIRQASEQLSPSAYDASGLAVQYRLTLRADAVLWRDGAEVWRADAVTVQGDVFASGGPSDIEAQQSSVSQQLHKAWVRRAMAQLQSGF